MIFTNLILTNQIKNSKLFTKLINNKIVQTIKQSTILKLTLTSTLALLSKRFIDTCLLLTIFPFLIVSSNYGTTLCELIKKFLNNTEILNFM